MLNLDSVLAYLDPGTGSLIAQFLIAGIISGAAVFSGTIASFKRYFTGSSRRSTSTQQLSVSVPEKTAATDMVQQRQAA